MCEENKIDFSQKDEHNDGRVGIPDFKYDPLSDGCCGGPRLIILQLPEFLRIDDN